MLELTSIQRQLQMNAKLIRGTTKCQKDIASENKTVWITKLHGVHGNLSGTVAGSEACSLHLQEDLRSTYTYMYLYTLPMCKLLVIIYYQTWYQIKA